MFYIDKNSTTFSFFTTLGSADTMNPPALALYFKRHGTNEEITQAVDSEDIITGRYVRIINQPTNIFAGSGQYDYIIYDITDLLAPVQLEEGICIVTIDTIEKITYDTDKQRGEFKQAGD